MHPYNLSTRLLLMALVSLMLPIIMTPYNYNLSRLRAYYYYRLRARSYHYYRLRLWNCHYHLNTLGLYRNCSEKKE